VAGQRAARRAARWTTVTRRAAAPQLIRPAPKVLVGAGSAATCGWFRLRDHVAPDGTASRRLGATATAYGNHVEPTVQDIERLPRIPPRSRSRSRPERVALRPSTATELCLPPGGVQAGGSGTERRAGPNHVEQRGRVGWASPATKVRSLQKPCLCTPGGEAGEGRPGSPTSGGARRAPSQWPAATGWRFT